MTRNQSKDVNKIVQVIQQINQYWLQKQYDKIGDLIAEDVVVVPPGFVARIKGREAYVQSYRDYDQSAITKAFSPAEPEIDVIGDTAVAVYTFKIEYEIAGKAYLENGRELLVLSSSSGTWRVVWRTMFIDSTK